MRHIDFAKLKEEDLLEAVQRDWNLITDLPSECYTESFCLAALKISKDWSILQHFARPSDVVYKTAISMDGAALQYVPIFKRSEELCMQAIHKGTIEDDFTILALVPVQTDSLCLESVMKDGLALRCVTNQNEEICIEALKQNPKSIKYLRVWTPKINSLVINCLRKNWELIVYIDNANKTDEMRLAALKNDTKAANNFSRHSSEAFYLKALKIDPFALSSIEKQKVTDRMRLAAVKGNWRTLIFIDRKDLTEELCVEAYNQDVMALRLMPSIWSVQMNNVKHLYKNFLQSIEKDELIRNELLSLKTERDLSVSLYFEKMNSDSASYISKRRLNIL